MRNILKDTQARLPVGKVSCKKCDYAVILWTRPYLTPVQGPAGEDWLDSVVHSPGGGEGQGDAPDEGQLPVAITELCPDMERGGDDMVPGDGYEGLLLQAGIMYLSTAMAVMV